MKKYFLISLNYANTFEVLFLRYFVASVVGTLALAASSFAPSDGKSLVLSTGFVEEISLHYTQMWRFLHLTLTLTFGNNFIKNWISNCNYDTSSSTHIIVPSVLNETRSVPSEAKGVACPYFQLFVETLDAAKKKESALIFPNLKVYWSSGTTSPLDFILLTRFSRISSWFLLEFKLGFQRRVL